MYLQDTQKVIRFVEQIVDDNIVSQIERELKSKPYWDLESMLQENGCSTASILARKMFNIYKDQLGKG